MWTVLSDVAQGAPLLDSLGPEQGPLARAIRTLASKPYADRVFLTTSLDGYGLTLAPTYERREESPTIWFRLDPRARRFAVRYEGRPGEDSEEFSCEEGRLDPLLSALMLRMVLGRRP